MRRPGAGLVADRREDRRAAGARAVLERRDAAGGERRSSSGPIQTTTTWTGSTALWSASRRIPTLSRYIDETARTAALTDRKTNRRRDVLKTSKVTEADRRRAERLAPAVAAAIVARAAELE